MEVISNRGEPRSSENQRVRRMYGCGGHFKGLWNAPIPDPRRHDFFMTRPPEVWTYSPGPAFHSE
eukprot:8553713-Pyramimonas_sp.AAC.1